MLYTLYSIGVKFIVIADNKQQKVEELLRKIYELYADYVLKNPFYSLDMPIRLAQLHVVYTDTFVQHPTFPSTASKIPPFFHP